jgi:hypothetical protein
MPPVSHHVPASAEILLRRWYDAVETDGGPVELGRAAILPSAAIKTRPAMYTLHPRLDPETVIGLIEVRLY